MYACLKPDCKSLNYLLCPRCYNSRKNTIVKNFPKFYLNNQWPKYEQAVRGVTERAIVNNHTDDFIWHYDIENDKIKKTEAAVGDLIKEKALE